jgi:radical SAM protein with 4Fe4S-binding SPASM domain
MCIIHKYNAGSQENLKALGAWMMRLSKMGITGGRVNPAYGAYELTDHEIYWTWRNVYNWNKKYGWSWNPVVEMEKNLKGEKGTRQTFAPAPCVNNQCDPFNTHTISILPNGFIGNCDRTFSHGFYCRSQSGTKSGRYQALEQTECKDCSYWSVCGGGCPEEGCGGDWRSKTRFCEAIKKTYEFLEGELRKNIPGIELIVDKVSTPSTIIGNSAHGDSPHGDSNHGDSNHGDSAHGDANHGDSSHGDDVDWE